jgi:hypothetical protein
MINGRPAGLKRKSGILRAPSMHFRMFPSVQTSRLFAAEFDSICCIVRTVSAVPGRSAMRSGNPARNSHGIASATGYRERGLTVTDIAAARICSHKPSSASHADEIRQPMTDMAAAAIEHSRKALRGAKPCHASRPMSIRDTGSRRQTGHQATELNLSWAAGIAEKKLTVSRQAENTSLRQ